MWLQRASRSVLLVLTLVESLRALELFIEKSKHRNVQSSAPFVNNSYEMPLFQTRYLSIRVRANELRRKDGNWHVVGFEFQMKSSNPNIVEMQKDTPVLVRTVNETRLDSVLIQDLYILRRKNAVSHVLNAYPSPTLIQSAQNDTGSEDIVAVWLMKGATIGVTNLNMRLQVFYDDDTTVLHSRPISLLVSAPKRRIDAIFLVTIPFMVTGISIFMGVLLDTSVIVSIFKNPTPVLVGFVAQYGLMPFLAMAIAKLFHYTPLNSLALFVIGCCPGSGASNQWTVIFDGDVNLSAVMSFVSTATSFIMMPLYFYTLGQLYTHELSITVPFLGLARSLALVVIPYGIGICISHFFPKSRPFVQKRVKPLMIGVMLFFLVFGFIVYWHLLRMIELHTILTAPLLPFLGFIFGGFLAWVSRLNWTQIKTVGIEAGIQNTGIAFMIMMYSFPQPYATQAMIVPMIVSFLSTKPFWVLLIIRNQARKYRKRKELARMSVTTGKLIISNDQPALETDDNARKENYIEEMQRL